MNSKLLEQITKEFLMKIFNEELGEMKWKELDDVSFSEYFSLEI